MLAQDCYRHLSALSVCLWNVCIVTKRNNRLSSVNISTSFERGTFLVFLSPTVVAGDGCLPLEILPESQPFKWRQITNYNMSFTSVSQCRIVWSVLCPLTSSLFKPMMTTMAAARGGGKGGGGGASLVASTPCHFHACIVSCQQRCADCKSLFWHQSTAFDQRSTSYQTIAMCSLESAVRPHLNATLYTQYKPVW